MYFPATNNNQNVPPYMQQPPQPQPQRPFPQSQPNYPNFNNNNNNYNPAYAGNNNMMNNNLNNNPVQYFIGGKIGKREIIRSDYQTFLGQIKSTDWASNPMYKVADSVIITTPLSNSKKQGQSQNMNSNSSTIFSQYLIDTNSNLSSQFSDYIKGIEERKLKLENDKEKNKQNFIDSCLPGEISTIPLETLLKKIEENRSFIISKDPTLKARVQVYQNEISRKNFSNNPNNNPGNMGVPPQPAQTGSSEMYYGNYYNDINKF